MSDTREDIATGSGEDTTDRRRRRRVATYPSRSGTVVGWWVVKTVTPVANGAFLFLLLTLYLSLRA